MKQEKTIDWVQIKYQHGNVLQALKAWKKFTINQENTKKMLRACYKELRERKNSNENITIFRDAYKVLHKHFNKPKLNPKK